MPITFRGLATTWRTLGNAATTHDLFTIENTHATILVYVRSLVVQMDATAALTAVMPQVKTARTTAVPSNGTALAKGAFNTAWSSNAAIVLRGATASDGGAATAITATPGDFFWQHYVMRIHTLVGQILAIDSPVIPPLCSTDPIILRQNQALVVRVVAAAGTSNPATNHWFVQCVWEEDTP